MIPHYIRLFANLKFVKKYRNFQVSKEKKTTTILLKIKTRFKTSQSQKLHHKRAIYNPRNRTAKIIS